MNEKWLDCKVYPNYANYLLGGSRSVDEGVAVVVDEGGGISEVVVALDEGPAAPAGPVPVPPLSFILST